jgi:hypothetical protein
MDARSDPEYQASPRMLPQGEVALIFVGIGHSLGVIDDSLFAALVAVIVLLAFGSGVGLWSEISQPR